MGNYGNHNSNSYSGEIIMVEKTIINNFYGSSGKKKTSDSEPKSKAQKKNDRRVKRRVDVKEHNKLLLEELHLIAISLGKAIMGIVKAAYHLLFVAVLGFFIFAEAPEKKPKTKEKEESESFKIKI